MTPRLDMHCHVAPSPYLDAIAEGRVDAGITAGDLPSGPDAHAWTSSPSDVSSWLQSAGLDGAAVSVVPTIAPLPGDPGARAEASRCLNEALLAWRASQPAGDRGVYHLLASVPTTEPRAAVAELEWAMSAGFAGVQIATSFGADGEGLDAATFESFWSVAAERGSLVFVHPSRPRNDPRYGAHYLRNLAGNPTEVGLAAATLIFGGVLERWPSLRIVLSHGGGSVVAMVGRWDRGASVRSALVGDLGASPSELAGFLHFDTIAHDPKILDLIAGRWGIERLVVGTDRPFPLGDPDPLSTLHAAGFSESAIDTIARENPMRLLQPVVTPAAP